MGYAAVKGVYFAVALFLSSWVGSCFVMLPSLPIAIMAPNIYRSYVQFMMGTWLLFPPSIYELLFGTTIHVSGDKMRRSERSLIIANHRTRLDWMFLWSVTGRAKWSALLKIILRGDLKHLPGFGWAMQFAGYFFLSRRWKNDEHYLTKKIKYLMASPEPYKLLIFPEGTDYDTNTKKKSDAYADKEGLHRLEYVLHPRTTGFVHCVTESSKGEMSAIYDLTLGYPKTLPGRGEMDIFTGTFPEEIHVHIKRHDFASLPQDPQAIDSWLRERWYEKETILENFYKRGKFTEEDSSKPYFPSSSNNFILPIFLIWNLGLCFLIYLLYISPVTRSYFLFANVILILISSFGLLEDLDRRCEPVVESSAAPAEVSPPS